jgi:hypothetical protein
MIDDDIVRRAYLEIGRFNRELAAIHEDEERCKLRRSRIETQKAQVQLFIDQANLARRLAAQPDDPTKPIVHIEKLACGANLVRVEAPKEPPQQGATAPATLERRKVKPDGLPTVAAMIVTALREAGKASRPAEIAEFVRQRWWAEASIKTITTTAWQMAEAGKLTDHDGRYGLNGAGHNGAGH